MNPLLLRGVRVLGTGVAILLLSALLAEAVLQLAARFVGDRAMGWRPGSVYRILAVGDSHTYGAFAPRDQTYPAQLQSLLDARDRGHYSVLNRGVPGMSTAQLRNRLPVWLSRHAPDLVIVWAGINNPWNEAESDARAGARLTALAHRSRLFRFLRVWLHDRRLERVTAGPDWQVIGVEGALGEVEKWRIRYRGREETVIHRRRPEDPGRGSEIEAAAADDFAALVEQAQAAGAGVILITYPYDADWFAVANRAMRRVGQRYGLPLVNSSLSVRRLPAERRELTWAAHPTPVMYKEIARDILPLVPPPAERP
jgi:lysophospholipase L1-like esterase